MVFNWSALQSNQMFMYAIHTISALKKLGSPNCRLKSGLANFTITGVVFNPNDNHLFVDLPAPGRKRSEIPLEKQPFQLLTDTMIMSHRIRGLSMQRTT